VAVGKVQFRPKQPKFGGYEMPRKLRKLFVGHPTAILFLLISRAGVFQQPQALSQLCAFVRQIGERKAQACAKAMLRQLSRGRSLIPKFGKSQKPSAPITRDGSMQMARIGAFSA
jgi:hypothetical protein